MTHIPGQLMHATVKHKDGRTEAAIVYLSIRVPGENGSRANHCWRYAPPSHEVVDGQVTPGEYVVSNSRNAK